MTTAVLAAALDAYNAGLCPIPAARDGTKRPYDSWKQYQRERPNHELLTEWFGEPDPYPGLGIICGHISGNLEMLEFEGIAVQDDLYDELVERARSAGIDELIERISHGYEEFTPSGGIHWLYHCPQIVGNLKLARRPGDQQNTVTVLIETRGEGGFTIVAPSDGSTHPTGMPWVLINGGFSTIATITPSERAELHRLCATFDRMPTRIPTLPSSRQLNGERPGDHYNATTAWSDILEPKGWTPVYQHGEETAWRRPGKTTGISATTNHLGTDRLKVFTSSSPFDTETTYDKFGAYALLEHGGDLTSAARALADRPLRAVGPPPAQDTPDETDDEPSLFIHWPDFWNHEPIEHEWILERILARGRGHAIYAARKVGKSLVMLQQLAELLITTKDILVIYLDFEMSADDLRERLEDMGYDAGTDLSRLRYALLPALLPLDTPEGAQALLEIVDREHERQPECHVIVIVDTTARAVQGPENDADTFRAFYRYTGIGLKRRGHTWARIDHSGHDPTRQRGSSAKGDDVDIVWRLERADNGYLLRRDAARMGWVPERVVIEQLEAPLRFVLGSESWPAGTYELADTLAQLGVPVEATNKMARAALRGAGRGASNKVIAAALKYRRGDGLDRGTPLGTPFWDELGSGSEGDGESPTYKEERRGERGGTPFAVDGERPPYLYTGSYPNGSSEEPDNDSSKPF